MKKRHITLFTGFAAAIALAPAAQAQTIIPQGQLTATSGGTDATWDDEAAVVDGTQMTGEGATGLHKGTLSVTPLHGWYTPEANNWFKVDLGATVAVGKMYVWNGQEEIYDRGVGSADIYYSTVETTDAIPTGGASSGDWILITDDQAFNLHPDNSDDFLPTDAFDLDVTARSIGLYLSVDAVGQGGMSLAELQFFTAGSTPPAADPEITSITSLGSGNFELTLKGEPSTTYEFRSSPTLDFTPGDLVAPLTVTLGGGGTLDVTTDGSGDATVQMPLAGSANFVRAVGP